MDSKLFFGIKMPVEYRHVQATFSEEDKKAYVELSELYFDNLIAIGAIQTTLDNIRKKEELYNEDWVRKVVGLTDTKDSYMNDNENTLGLMKEIESKYQTTRGKENL